MANDDFRILPFVVDKEPHNRNCDPQHLRCGLWNANGALPKNPGKAKDKSYLKSWISNHDLFVIIETKFNEERHEEQREEICPSSHICFDVPRSIDRESNSLNDSHAITDGETSDSASDDDDQGH